ncbi:MAG: hypothetical protein ACRCUQ_04745 [Alphaproteobacteria bacterium]
MLSQILTTALALSEVVPLIGRWLGNEEGEKLAHNVVNFAKQLTGETEAPSMLKILSNNPDLLLQFQKIVAQMEADLYQDRRDARAREIALLQTGHRNVRADIMVISAAFGLILCLAALAFYRESLPGEAVGIISTIAGIFGSCLKDAYAFEFGSSRGSKEKDERVTALLNHQSFLKDL